MKKVLTGILALSLAVVPAVSVAAAESSATNMGSVSNVSPEGSGYEDLGMLGGQQKKVNTVPMNVSYGGSVTVSIGTVLDRLDNPTSWSLKVWLYNQTTGQSTVVNSLTSAGIGSTTFSGLNSGNYDLYIQNSTSKLLFFGVSYLWN